MSATHLHLLFNHVPILGCFFGLALLGAGAVSHAGNRWLTRAALGFFVVVGLSAVAADLTGEPAEHELLPRKLPGITHHAIHEHEESAEAAFIAAALLGAAALGTFLLQQRDHPATRRALWAVWGLALVTAGLMARTGYEGGLIRRPDLRGELNQGIEE